MTADKPLWISGVAMPGDGRGRALGFPTANLTLDNVKELPLTGVYAGWGKIESENSTWKSAIHVGPRPTFGEPLNVVEVHFLDFPDRDLYDEKISFQIVRRLRDVETFDSVEDLVTGLTRDCNQVSELLS